MLIDRMFRAAMLDPLVFDEVKEDRESMTQAVQVILIVLVIGILSTLVQNAFGPEESLAQTNLSSSLGTSAATTVLGWLLWAFLAYLIGTGVFGGTATYAEMLRAVAFAQSPVVITILTVPLMFLPFAGQALAGLLGFAAAIWVLVVNVIALRQTLGISTGKATIMTVIIAITLIVISVVATYIFFPEMFQFSSQ